MESNSFLHKVLKVKRKEVEASRKLISLEEMKELALSSGKSFKSFYDSFSNFSVISEVKIKSPAEGVLDSSIDVVRLALDYESGGADVISVLTDKYFFHGDLSYLRDISLAVSIPVLRKDFIIDSYQVYEARVNGADAILLIVAALSIDQLSEFICIAEDLGMGCLIEIHNKFELDLLSPIIDKVKVLGINNRNLKTLGIDLHVFEELAPLVPSEIILVGESGISGVIDSFRLRSAGANGILVGSYLMKQKDKSSAVRILKNNILLME
ncbi:MAG: indole-3-glycerol phosphate synthase [Patescibacteria group bacterium]|jgi:indole-3-glycerol phosphate synthase